jgi:hypothetical protein
MRSITAPFVVAPPAGARVRTRIRPSQQDVTVLHLVGEYLGGLAGGDLARRCAVGPGADGRAGRKRSLTAQSSSRWAGVITRTSESGCVQGTTRPQPAPAAALSCTNRQRRPDSGSCPGGARPFGATRQRRQRLTHQER